ncbi:protein BRANCHLESS TRICHOME-like isoform X2 [Salvia splendens]|uniref:protein BRANCHLESS TRICHOME-like isoform X2 n=1 Tax=Salvia splendens TaxID=180675 RepID=UPI001C265D9E|nr:protein BRANCHLESS TRICHOME-like isoform X2 [Salvia splendens]
MVPDARIPRPNRSPAATPPQHRNRPLSARNLAASLWRSTAAGGTASFDRLCFQFPTHNLEGATKWDCCDYLKSRKHVNEVETGMKYRMRKMEAIENMADGVRAERRICKDIKKMNASLLRDIGDVKSSAMKLLRNLQKERKAREELEGACYGLAREIEARRAETLALREQQQRVRLEVEKERRVRQMAEVWREEQAQMKLAEANFILEDRYAEVLRRFLNQTTRLQLARMREQVKLERGVAVMVRDR